MIKAPSQVGKNIGLIYLGRKTWDTLSPPAAKAKGEYKEDIPTGSDGFAAQLGREVELKQNLSRIGTDHEHSALALAEGCALRGLGVYK